MGSYDPIYAIIYAYFSEDENADDPEIYKIILSDYEISDPPEQGCYEQPILFCATTKNERAVQCSHESSRDRSGFLPD